MDRKSSKRQENIKGKTRNDGIWANIYGSKVVGIIARMQLF